MATFTGPRNDNFDLVDDLKETIGDILSIRDDIGGKKANVYWLIKQEGEDDAYSQVLPTPDIKNLSHDANLMEGGIVPEGELLLTDLTISKFSESDLETSGQTPGLRKYWIISGPGLNPRAYTCLLYTSPSPRD